jgi:hypothetical protein
MSERRLRGLYEEVEAWHEEHGFDMGLLFERRPDLFRSLLEYPRLFDKTELGRRYHAAAARMARKAEQRSVYAEMFSPLRSPRTIKEEVSIGLVPEPNQQRPAQYRRAARKSRSIKRSRR